MRFTASVPLNAHPVGLLLVATLGVVACGRDSAVPFEPLAASAPAAAAMNGAKTIVVSTAAELVNALVPENAGARIHVRAGSYGIDRPLAVPDRAILEGEGVMLFDASGLPTGFASGTRTSVTMTANVPGNVITLGNRTVLRNIAIEDLVGRSGNVVAVLSREGGDRILAEILETEIVMPNRHGIAPSGPTGCGLAVLTLNPNLGADPPPHEGSTISTRVVGSLIRGPAARACGLFANNFAANGNLAVTLTRSVVGGGIIASGGVSRTDAVHDSRVRIDSRGSLYRDDFAGACSELGLGWNLGGGSGPPVAALTVPATERNTLVINSIGDRIEGFRNGVLATGARRFFDAPRAGPSNGNGVELNMLDTRIATPACGGYDINLAGAEVAGDFPPGDGNYVHASLHRVIGSGTRANMFSHVVRDGGSLSPGSEGSGNRLGIVGNLRSFTTTNAGIDPAPAPEFFTAKR